MRCRGTLHTGWTLRPIADQTPAEVPVGIAGAEIAARVPGAVHTDLLAAELIPDPYLDQNEAELTWIWRTGWRYETRFTFPGESADRVDLVCDGLDTIATVEVNGTQVASTANMHRSYRFEVTRLLRAGDNRLAINFGSALNHAERERDRMGYLPVPTTASAHPINFIRKMACNFGWDWGPALITAGIWRPIALESWSTARLARVRPAVTVTGGHGRVRVAIDLERAGASTGLQLLARVAGRQVRNVVRPTATQATLDIDVPNPDLWWPQGYGEHPLYDLQVELREASESAGHEQGRWTPGRHASASAPSSWTPATTPSVRLSRSSSTAPPSSPRVRTGSPTTVSPAGSVPTGTATTRTSWAGTASSPAGWPPISRCRRPSTTGISSTSSTSLGRSPPESNTSGRTGVPAWAPSSGSSTTAGPSPPGPRSTGTAGSSRCGTRCGGCINRSCSPCSHARVG